VAALPRPDRGAAARGRELVGLITFSHALQHLYTAVLPLTYPLAVAEFHASYTALGVLLGVVGVVGGLLQGMAGVYQRITARVVLTVQQLALAATLVVTGLAPGFAAFGAGRFLGAIVSSPQHPVGNAVLSRHFPERRGTVLSWHTTGGNIGTLVVPLVASVVIARYGWRVALLAFAVPIAVGGLLLALRLREPALPEHGRHAHLSGARLREVILRRPTLAIMLAGTVAAGGRGLGVITAYVPAYLRSGLGLPQITVGLVFTVVMAGSIVGPVLAGHLADRIGRRRVVLATYLLGALVLLAFGAIGRDLPLLLVTGALVGVLAYAESPLLQALFADAVQGAPQQAAFGVFFAVSYGAGSIWVTALGITIDHLGFAPTFALMGASFVAAAGMVVLAGRERRPSSVD
jgi:MFS family permease